MQTLAKTAATRSTLVAHLLTCLSRHLAGIEAAHQAQATRTALGADVLRDTGLGPDDLLGPDLDAQALPFFFRR